MKSRIQGTDASISLAHNIAPGQIEQVEVCSASVTRVKAQLLTRSDAAARFARIKVLKAQIDAGRYVVDSRAIVQKILISHNNLDVT